jgi:hypothetical protein
MNQRTKEMLVWALSRDRDQGLRIAFMLEELLNGNVSQTVLAATLGCHRRTVARDMKLIKYLDLFRDGKPLKRLKENSDWLMGAIRKSCHEREGRFLPPKKWEFRLNRGPNSG